MCCLQRGLVTVFSQLFFFLQLEWWKVCRQIAQMCHFSSLICFWIFPPFNWFFSIVWNHFSSSNPASGVFNKKSDREGQQTKLSTTLWRLKWCLKFAHCLHHVCVSSEMSLLSNLQRGFCLCSFSDCMNQTLFVCHDKAEHFYLG